MAVSSSIDFTVSTRKVIERSLRLVQAIRSGDVASSAQISECKTTLNSIVRELDLRRVGLWMFSSDTITTVAAQASYGSADGLAVDINRLETATFLKSTTDEMPLEIMGYTEYEKIGNKTQAGDPRKIFLSDDRDLAVRTVKLWPVPSSVATFRIRYRRPIYDFDDDANEPDFPAAWFSTLSFLLASEIADEYNVENAKADRLMLVADRKMKDMKAAGVKNTTNSKEKDNEYY